MPSVFGVCGLTVFRSHSSILSLSTLVGDRGRSLECNLNCHPVSCFEDSRHRSMNCTLPFYIEREHRTDRANRESGEGSTFASQSNGLETSASNGWVHYARVLYSTEA